MEYGWERTFPFLKIDNNIIGELLEGILENDYITNVIPINEGCRTTNYIVDTNIPEKKYILKIFFSKEQNYKKEIKLLAKLKEDKLVNVATIYKVGNNEIIQNREYAIYEYMQGKTIGKAISEGYSIENNFIKDVAQFLAQIHSYKFEKAGFLDENLKVVNELPPLILWYEKFMGSKAKERLGKDLVHKILYIVNKNGHILNKLDNDIRLVHGDFQGTNILIKDNKLGGVIDWEFAMAGHPLADIGQFFRYEEYFSKDMIKVFEEEYNKISSYKLTNDWYEISKLRDLANLIQLINGEGNMPNKYSNIKDILINNITLLSS
ncbi:aminoglycoside phosphotransferase family protein [Clostridium chromiireducens]|uniref:Phosphotransferase n=1 Tax=Clostridium chromiireducens TaxID=225345 RepID=A0A1V4J0D6_9CLOT|nr:aminoglycoside phosphotransferase family protein [Clostridium chromiireducens]MVX64957.1 phosphotransferase [Clostridium chromiireducens]OPJ65768.1 homoserine kinase [Clostridium chromiireducens]RII32166.1 aminoglycoside phosphotransferase family protein [Clostridium chromiireducens]